MAVYADDVVVQKLPGGEVDANGKAALRYDYAELFAGNPELSYIVTQRITHGDWVVDHELVTGIRGAPRQRAVATYLVRDGLIRKVWFLPTVTP